MLLCVASGSFSYATYILRYITFPQVNTNVVVQQPVVVQRPVFRNYPVTIIDSNGQQVTTNMQCKSMWIVHCIMGRFLILLFPLSFLVLDFSWDFDLQHKSCTHKYMHAQVTTRLEYRAGNMTWLIFFLICFITGLPIGIIAFFIDDTKDVYHISPTDGEVVGVYKRMGC